MMIKVICIVALYSTNLCNHSQCIHLVEWFEHYNHVCMVFELLDQSIYDFLKSNDFTPFPLVQIQHFAKQLLNSVACKYLGSG